MRRDGGGGPIRPGSSFKPALRPTRSQTSGAQISRPSISPKYLAQVSRPSIWPQVCGPKYYLAPSIIWPDNLAQPSGPMNLKSAGECQGGGLGLDDRTSGVRVFVPLRGHCARNRSALARCAALRVARSIAGAASSNFFRGNLKGGIFRLPASRYLVV